jgi:hypothetical protein
VGAVEALILAAKEVVVDFQFESHHLFIALNTLVVRRNLVFGSLVVAVVAM